MRNPKNKGFVFFALAYIHPKIDDCQDKYIPLLLSGI